MLKTSLNISAAILFSLGVLSPNLVKSVGLKISMLLNAEPKSDIMKSAKYKVVELDTFKKYIEVCFIRLAIELATYFFALFLVGIIYIAFGVWLALSGRSFFCYPISILSLTLGLLCVIGFLQELGLVKKAFLGEKYFDAFLKIIYADKLVIYSVLVVGRVLSVFTMDIPYLWYRALKEIHARGVSWVATVLGLALFIISSLM